MFAPGWKSTCTRKPARWRRRCFNKKRILGTQALRNRRVVKSWLFKDRSDRWAYVGVLDSVFNDSFHKFESLAGVRGADFDRGSHKAIVDSIESQL